MTGVYTTRVAVRHHELDAFGRVQPAVYLRYLAHAAVEASADAGFDASWYSAAGTVWLVRRSTFTLHRPGRAGDELELRTWVEDFRRVRSHRRYELRTRSGPPDLEARTDWVYVEVATGRPRRVPESMERAFASALAATQARDGWRAPAPPPNPARSAHRVRLHELDSLGHVNNAVYLDVLVQAAFDAFEPAGWPLDRFVAEGAVPTLVGADLEYLEAARYGDTLETRTWFTPHREGMDIHQEVGRAADARTLVRGTTAWRWVEPRAGTPKSVPSGLLAGLAPLRAA